MNTTTRKWDVYKRQAVESTTLLIQSIYDEVAKYKDFCGIALTEKDLVRLKNEGKKAFFIAVSYTHLDVYKRQLMGDLSH